MRDGIYDDAAAVTHMSNDTDSIESLTWQCQEAWATMIEVLIGMGMLWNQLGWWCITPVTIVIRKSTSSVRSVVENADQYIRSIFTSGQTDWKQSWRDGCGLAESKTKTDRVDELYDRLYQKHQDGTLLCAILLVITTPVTY
jgi:hypothetical protein